MFPQLSLCASFASSAFMHTNASNTKHYPAKGPEILITCCLLVFVQPTFLRIIDNCTEAGGRGPGWGGDQTTLITISMKPP